MGINQRVFELIAKHCRFPADGTQREVLFAGYPDLVLDFNKVEEILGQKNLSSSTVGELFTLLGYPVMVAIDIHKDQGSERIVDLNSVDQIPIEYDLVVDHGTIEHCFNIGQAAKYLAESVNENGFIVQHLPMNLYNHGFYNLNPTWFYSFYETNGFKIHHIEAWSLATNETFPLDICAHDQFRSVPENLLITMIAQRVEGKAITYPMQPKYSR